MGLSPEEQDTLFLAGALHDVGALSLQERLDYLEFETQDQLHGERAYRFLRTFPPLAPAAEYIRYHHTSWRRVKEGAEVPLGSLILHLADRIAVSIDEDEHILQQVPRIKAKIAGQSGECSSRNWSRFSNGWRPGSISGCIPSPTPCIGAWASYSDP